MTGEKLDDGHQRLIEIF